MSTCIIYEILNQYHKAKIRFVQAVTEITSHPQNNDYLNDAGILDLLCPLLWDVLPSVKQLSMVALARLANQDLTVAYMICKKNILSQLLKNIENQSYQILLTLTCIAKHSIQLSESILQPQLLKKIFTYELFEYHVVKTSTILVKEICKHSPELVEYVVMEGGVQFLIQIINTTRTSAKSSAIVALGYIAGYSKRIAMTIIEIKGLHNLVKIFEKDSDIHTFAITIWTIGQIGKHSFEHANAVAETNVLTTILMLYNNPLGYQELKIKCKTTLRLVLQKCMKIEVLEPLLHDSPSNILKYILNQFTKILPTDSKARRLFVTTGGLKKVQDIKVIPGSSLSRFIKIINCCFPEEIVRYYSPDYPGRLLEAVDHYQPNFSVIELSKLFNAGEDSYTRQGK